MPTSVIVATLGRRELVERNLLLLVRQTMLPEEVIISCAADVDFASGDAPFPVKVVKGAAGLTQQRNRGLKALSDAADIVVFFDDDFVPHQTWIEAATDHFARHADVAGLTGMVIADGINGPGISYDDALVLLDRAHDSEEAVSVGFSPYGCNMAFRRSAVLSEQFDERLVLYGWQEDRDFGARISKRGRLVKAPACKGVHLGTKQSRVSGLKLGYSQVVNPAYLHRKGTMATKAALSHICKNILANALRSLWPEPYVDRFGRLKGNVIGLWDLTRGRVVPERAATL